MGSATDVVLFISAALPVRPLSSSIQPRCLHRRPGFFVAVEGEPRRDARSSVFRKALLGRGSAGPHPRRLGFTSQLHLLDVALGTLAAGRPPGLAMPLSSLVAPHLEAMQPSRT